jgi:hypothetical protein
MRAALLAAAAVTVTVGATAATPVEVGVAAAIVGDVRLSNAAAPKERAVARKQRMAWGDNIRTMKQSELQILLLDRSNFTVAANTRMTIDKFVYDPSAGRSFFARVFEGAFRFMSGAKNPNSSAQVDSPVGTIGIRGTALDGVVGENAVAIAEKEPSVGKKVKTDPRSATLVVLRGPGAATEGGLTVGRADVTAAGKTVTLDRPELAAFIPRPGAPPIGPFQISAPGLSQVQDLLSFPKVSGLGKPKGNGGTFGKILGGAVAADVAGALLGGGGGGNNNNKRNPPQQGQRPVGKQPAPVLNNAAGGQQQAPPPPQRGKP